MKYHHPKYHQKREPRIDWGKKVFYFIFGAMMGSIIGFMIDARLHGGKLTWLTEVNPQATDILVFGGCAVVFGLISAIKGDDFWSRLLGR